MADESVLDDVKRDVYEQLLVINAPERPVWDEFKSNLSNLYHVLLSAQGSDKAADEEVSASESAVSGGEN